MKGDQPEFMEVMLTEKRVPVCSCVEERTHCDACKNGFIQAVEKGDNPTFKTVIVEEPIQPDPPATPALGEPAVEKKTASAADGSDLSGACVSLVDSVYIESVFC